MYAGAISGWCPAGCSCRGRAFELRRRPACRIRGGWRPGGHAGAARAHVDDPVEGGAEEHGAERPAEGGRAEPDVLEARGEDDERDDRADEAVGGPRGDERADEDGRDAADDDRRRDRELDVPEGQRAERGGQGEGHGLGEVGADELVRPEHRVEEEEQHDHQRARADRRHADDEAADHADGDRGERAARRRRR